MGYELSTVVQSAIYTLVASTVGYFLFLGVLTIPACQNQAIYMDKVTLTWGQDISVPEQWGFLHNQVSVDRKSTRLNSSHSRRSRMPSSA